MVVGVLDKAGSKAIVNNQDIIYSLEHQYIYGVTKDIRVGVPSINDDLEYGKEYTLIFSNTKPSKFMLISKYTEKIGNHKFTVYRFVKKMYKKLIENKLPNSFVFLGISFEHYIKERNNQLKYFGFGLKKKSLILISDEEYNPIQTHINKVVNAKPKQIQPVDVKDIEDFELFRKNYYCTTGARTKNGNSKPIFLQHATQQDIKGLDNYLIPKYEFFGNFVDVNIGDTVRVKDEKIVIIEKEVFFYRGKKETFFAGGIKS